MADKIVALTFDDGPNTTTTNQVLDMLEKYDVVASFFLIGNNINDASAEAVRRAYNMGCEIHNHSKTHPYMNTMTAEEIIEEFTYTDDKIFEITGERSKFFRPPYIAVSDRMFENIDVPFVAGIGCNDWDDRIPADRRTLMIMRQVKDGDVILLHDAEGNDLTVEALDTLIPQLKAEGYRFVTMTQLFEEKGIAISPDDSKIYTNVLQQYQYG
ncbi:MAG: polysaccharide deacetylase family protein [Oscillospiraceae bacterium]|nr:polysaccharide deacetylase family protein [Oscillospiraceae bacterium]